MKLDRNDAVMGAGIISLLGGIAHFSLAGCAIVAGAILMAWSYVTAK